MASSEQAGEQARASGARATAKPEPVIIHEVDSDGKKLYLIEGGFLPETMAWCPNDLVEHADDGPYLKISRKSKPWKALCGTSLSLNKFLEELEGLRKNACDEAIRTAKLAANPTTSHMSASEMFSRYKRVMSFEMVLPHHVTVALPDGIHMKMLFTLDYRVNVAFALTKENLDYVITAVSEAATMASAARHKRPRVAENICPGLQSHLYKEVKWNARMKCFYVNYKDADGHFHMSSHTPRLGEDLQEVQTRLHGLFVAHNADDPSD